MPLKYEPSWYIPKEPKQALNGKYYCPLCKVTVITKSRTCLVCGQILDWSQLYPEDEEIENDEEEI